MTKTLLLCVLGFTIGWIIGHLPCRHRRIAHENHNRPAGPPPLKLKRSKSVRIDEGRSYNQTNTAKDSSAERPRLWSEVRKPIRMDEGII